MVSGRKMMALLLIVGVLGLPAVLLRFLCVGHSCDEETAAASEVPFCSLDSELRSRITAGYREGRSPEVLAVARRASIAGGTGYARTTQPLWPSSDLGAARVPIVFAGEGVVRTPIPEGTTLASIAPTLASIIDFERPFPQVRSGEAIDGTAGGSNPRLLLQVILKGIGSDDLEAQPAAWPFLRGLMDEGAATMDADTGSLPLDPAAAISTIGTGDTPSQHGITGEFVRTGEGRLVRSFSNEAESPVIATLADDLDEQLEQRPLIGLVGTTVSDVGAVGGEWYGSSNDDEVVIARRDQVGPAVQMLSRSPGDRERAGRAGGEGGFGADRVPDLMSVVMDDGIPRLDRGLERIVTAANEAADGSVALVVTGTGSQASIQGTGATAIVSGTEVARDLDEALGERVTEAAVPGGLFLDQSSLTELELSEDLVIKELVRLRGPEGYLFEDVWPAIAVTFARYC